MPWQSRIPQRKIAGSEPRGVPQAERRRCPPPPRRRNVQMPDLTASRTDEPVVRGARPDQSARVGKGIERRWKVGNAAAGEWGDSAGRPRLPFAGSTLAFPMEREGLMHRGQTRQACERRMAQKRKRRPRGMGRRLAVRIPGSEHPEQVKQHDHEERHAEKPGDDTFHHSILQQKRVCRRNDGREGSVPNFVTDP